MTLIVKCHPRKLCTTRKPKTKGQPQFLTLQEFGLRQYILDRLNPEGLFKERAKAIAQYFGCTHPTISKVINHLVAKGCFEVVKETNSEGGQAEKTLRPLNPHVSSVKRGSVATTETVKSLRSSQDNPLKADLNPIPTNHIDIGISTATTSQQSTDLIPTITNNSIQALNGFKGVMTEQELRQPTKQSPATLRPGTRMQVLAPVTEKDVSPLLPLCPYCRKAPCDWGVFGGWLHIEATCGEKKCENAYVFEAPTE